MYGMGEKSVAIKIPENEILTILRRTGGERVLVDLIIGDEAKLATIQDVQRDPVTGKVIHVDFFLLQRDKEVEIEIPITTKGIAPGVKKGGILDVITHSLRIKALPQNIPPHIEIDISGLDVGGVIHVRDLSLPGVHILNPPDQPVVSVLAPRVAVEKPSEEAEAEGAEKPEAEGETETK